MTEDYSINPRFNNPSLILDRSDLLYELSSAIKKYNHVSLIGPPGSGKTTLVYQYLQNSKDFSNHSIRYFYGFDLDLDSEKLESFQNAISDKRRPLIIIDEFESIQSATVIKEINYRIREGRKYGAKTVIIGRNSLFEKELLNNTYVINLDNWKLSKKEINRLIKLYFREANLPSEKLEAVTYVLEDLGTSPLAVRMALELLQKADYSPEKLKLIIEKQIKYSNRIFGGNSDRDLIDLPNPPKIITDLIFINQSILDKVTRNPKSIYEISPRQFEELVAELFEKQGHKVTITQQTQDGGKDLLIVENRILGNFLCYVECKKYAPDNPVGVKVVRELFGTITADRATAGVVVTSSYFSKPAYTFTEKIRHQMNLIDYVKLSGIIEDVTRK